MKKFINIKTKYGDGYIFNMDNVFCIERFSGGMVFKFNFVSYLYQDNLMLMTGDTKFAAS